MKRRDLGGLDRNLELLSQELALRGSRLFGRTTSAACASASVSHGAGNSHFTAANDVPLGEGERIVIRERTARDGEEVRIYIAAASPPSFRSGIDRGGAGSWGAAIFGHADSRSNGQEPYVVSGMKLERVYSSTWQSFS